VTVVSIFSAIGFVLVLTALLLVVSSTARRVTLIGAMVGPALGLWIVAPISLKSHHLQPETLAQWGIVLAFFAVVFLAWSVVLAAVLSWPVAAYWLVRRPASEVSPMLAVLWTATSLPFGYVAVAAGIELSVFSRLVSFDALVRFIAVGVTAAGVGVAAYAWAARRGHSMRAGAVVLSLTAVLMAGVAALMARSVNGSPSHDDSGVPALVQRSGTSPTRPLLFIGLDGGSWQLLGPMIEQGRAPTFARLAASMKGTVEARWPPYWSTPAWGAILTGYGIEHLGVHEDLAATVRGLPLFELPLTLDLVQNPVYLVELGLIRANIIEPTPVPRDALRRPPVWERLSDAGVKTAVIRFPFTYPARSQATVVVSNRVVTDLWDLMSVEIGRREDLVSSNGDAEGLLSWFDEGFVVDDAELKGILPAPDWPQPADAVLDPTDVARKIFAIGQRMFSITEHLIREDSELDVVMLHVTDLDNISHAFWGYRFPDEFPNASPAAADVTALGPVPDRYVEYLDRQLARLIAAFPTPPNVLVVSDHGQEAAASSTMSLWKGWHSSRGVFMAGGPDIAGHDGELAVSYFDVVPTLLEILNFEKPADLAGRSLIRSPRHADATVADD
jgi:hypothetical protein